LCEKCEIYEKYLKRIAACKDNPDPFGYLPALADEALKEGGKMSIEKLMEIRNKAEAKIDEIDTLIQKRRRLKQLIIDVNSLRRNAGKMIFTGKSGKISEQKLLQQVSINDIGGCVAVPELILSLANERLKEYEVEMDYLLHKETVSTY